MLTRLLAIAVVAAGLTLALLGAALLLNLLSLRELVELTRLSAVIWVVFDVRDEVSHRRAQGLELLTGLVGVAIVSLAAWWFQSRARGVRRGR
jgi:hypothetical protein